MFRLFHFWIGAMMLMWAMSPSIDVCKDYPVVMMRREDYSVSWVLKHW